MNKPRLLLAIAAALAVSNAAAAATLERVVIVERHGVRSPTKAPEALSAFSAQPWPAWPVGVGILTDHGAQDMRLMGAALRRVYAAKGLLPETGCPAAGAVDVWADGADQRTRASGQLVLDGAFPGCGLVARHGPEGASDPVFDAVGAGACPIDGAQARAAVLERVRGDLDHPARDYGPAQAALYQVLAGPAAAPCKDASGACAVLQPNTLSTKGDGLKLQGGLGIGATIAESLLLEYAEGMPADAVGWGRAGSAAQIASLMPVHRAESELMRRTPYLARHNAAVLLADVADAVEGKPGLPGETAAAPRLAVFAGHDTNLDNLAGSLGLDWRLPGQPDETPPGGALVFEVWRDAHGQRTVRAAILYQSLDQLRDASPLDAAHPVGRAPVRLAGCDPDRQGACRLDAFLREARAAIPADCRP